MNLWICNRDSILYCCDCRLHLAHFQAGVAYRADQIEGLFRGHLEECEASRAWARWSWQIGVHLHPLQISDNQAYDDTIPHPSNGPLEPFVRRLLTLPNWSGNRP